MTPQKLKNSILQLAIQGKLVEQRPEEGTAEELYKQIQAEKQALIRKKLIKEEKPLQDYEDPPFDIPDSWIWARITDCGVFISGFTPKTDELCKDGVIPYFKVSDMNTVGNELWLTKTEQYLKIRGLRSSSSKTQLFIQKMEERYSQTRNESLRRIL